MHITARGSLHILTYIQTNIHTGSLQHITARGSLYIHTFMHTCIHTCIHTGSVQHITTKDLSLLPSVCGQKLREFPAIFFPIRSDVLYSWGGAHALLHEKGTQYTIYIYIYIYVYIRSMMWFSVFPLRSDQTCCMYSWGGVHARLHEKETQYVCIYTFCDVVFCLSFAIRSDLLYVFLRWRACTTSRKSHALYYVCVYVYMFIFQVHEKDMHHVCVCVSL